MNFMTIKETAIKWNISTRRVQILCSEGRIKGAFKHGNAWFIPKDTNKPEKLKRGPKSRKGN